MEKEFEFAWQSGLFLAVCLGLFFIAKLIFGLFNRKLAIDAELVDKDNLAFYTAYVCYFLGFIAIVGGVMNSSGSGEFWEELVYTLIYGLIGIVLLNLITVFSDRILHPRQELWDETVNGNTATGILKGGNYLSTGIIIGGIMLTEVDRPVQAAIFLVCALLIASIGFMYYSLIAPFNVKDEIYKGNAAVAISAAGAQIAFAILIHAGFQIEHSGWQSSLVSIGIDVLGGLILLPLIRFVIDVAFIPKRRRITDEIVNQEKPNFGLGLFEAAAYVGGALLFVWCWNL